MSENKSAKGRAVGTAVAACLLLAALFLFPDVSVRGILNGFRLAFMRVVPAVFPFLVFSQLILESPLSRFLGIVFYPFSRALGLRDKTAATALFLGFLGGFAVLANCVSEQYKKRRIDRRQAELLLCAGMNTGPAFIVMTVGFGMFGHIGIGVFLLAASFLSNFIAALFVRILTKDRKVDFEGAAAQAPDRDFPQNLPLVDAVRKAALTSFYLCAFIALFSLLCSLAGCFLKGGALTAVTILLEVTNGCLHACESASPFRVYICLLALNWTGFSILLQARSLLAPEISLKPFFFSRLFSLPLCVILYYALTRLFPRAITTAALYVGKTSRFSCLIVFVFLLLVGAFLYECTPKKVFTDRLQKDIIK